MKNTKFFFAILCSILAVGSNAQTFNWNKLDRKHIINVGVSADYGLTYGVGYNYKLKAKFPIVLNLEYSFPSGENITDDFKTKVGAQVNWFHTGNLHFVTKVHGIFRRYQNDYTRLINFGSDLSGILGYYKSKWFVAGEVGFDKAIVTHFKHSEIFKSNYPVVEDGWYEPSTGGNFYYGVQAGISGKKFDVYLKAGKLIEQDFRTSPMLPIYGQLGVNFNLR